MMGKKKHKTEHMGVGQKIPGAYNNLVWSKEKQTKTYSHSHLTQGFPIWSPFGFSFLFDDALVVWLHARYRSFGLCLPEGDFIHTPEPPGFLTTEKA